ncbi:hypothetical protein [Gemelliphila palaticanis]|uniref:Uncharacterized protein n=1 Tax=Gemelliphila palaticanis TaxID=81950 RepID=A0ABX2SXK6_9BACL|nr:hypothetical protein [Gemella palaticanis]MBF0715056.1 hypothetical protein [Gemella palaticanis]NYS46986.1 hypothetical protein [Gemella palaticanis]
MKKILLCSAIMTSFLYLENFNVSKANFSNFKTFYDNNLFENSNSIMFHSKKIPSPSIETKLEEGIPEIKYRAYLVDYNNNSYNYLVFYNKKSDGSVEELFRERILKNGSGVINNLNLLEKIVNNSIIFARVESFNFLPNQKISYTNVSKNSVYYYTPKNYSLNILEEGKVVSKENILYKNEVADKNIKIPISDLTNYKLDKYYTYSGSKIRYDNNYVNSVNGYITIPYDSEEISIELAKNLSNWRDIEISYPNKYKDKNKILKGKSGIGFKTFLKKYNNEFEKIKSDNYILDNYYIDDINIYKYDKLIKDNLKIKAIFKTKIKIEADNKEDTIYLKTGQNLSEIDLAKYYKDNYDIESFTITNNDSGEIFTVNDISSIVVNDSLTININYKEQISVLKIRQDDYNSRFGIVDESIKNKDIKVSKNKISKEILEILKNKITPNDGYEVKFRINKKEVEDNTYFKNDSILEIYFKKVPEKWINVKFVGEGIDKFLSDGQEILVGSNINSLNLPTSSGTNKELLGWKANHDYKINKSGNVVYKSKDNLLQLNDIQNIITEKNKNLIFTAEYFEPYYLEIINDINGTVSLGKDNKIYINNLGNLKNSLNSSIYIKPRAHHIFSHFTSTLPVLIDDKEGNIKIIPIGKKITLTDFYNIIPNQNLTLNSHFVFYNNFIRSKDFIKLDLFSKSEEYDNLILNNYDKNINNDILGPFIFLK